MHIFTPLPDWLDLIRGAWAATRRQPAATTLWATDDEQAQWFSSGAQILLHVVRERTMERGSATPAIWFPDYFCDAATRLVRDQKISLVFYPINARLNPDWDACEALAESGPSPDIFVLVHYFGRAGEARKASEFCRKAGALLLEDAAHALNARGSMGAFGDAIFYCPHKVLPTPDGALLSGSSPKPKPANIHSPKPSSIAWLLKRATQKILPNPLLRYRIRRLPGFTIDSSAPTPVTSSAPSPLGQSMINLYADRLAVIAETRKRSAGRWRESFQSHGEICRALLSVDEEGPAPYRFVLKCRNREMAEKCFAAFRLSGIAVESWPDLAPEVRRNPSVHATACELRETLLFLPVFNALPGDLSTIVDDCIERALSS